MDAPTDTAPLMQDDLPAGRPALIAGQHGAAKALRSVTAYLGSQRESFLLFAPVLLGLGILLFFGLDRDPPAGLALAAALLLAVPLWLYRAQPAMRAAALLAGLVLLGYQAAEIRVALVAAPVLEREIGPVRVTGRIADIERDSRGARAIIEIDRIADISPKDMPRRVRLRFAGRLADSLEAGRSMQAPAVLGPPPQPVAPGAYDTPRALFFKGIGGVGYAVGEAAPVDGQPQRTHPMERLRQAISARIGTVMDADTGAVADALLTGERRAVPEHVIQQFRDAGIAHLLAISGLHIGLVAGCVFFVLRAGMALIEPVALTWPTKKIAALGGLLAAAGYTLLVDAPIPTQRALLMTAVVLVAILLDRKAISLRLVALAAFLVLLIAPEALLGPSFQMSFAAVLCLVAAYEALPGRWQARAGGAPLWLKPPIYLAGVVLTTLIASAATAPFSLYHFQHLSVLGQIANLAAVPLVAFWVMPFGLLAYLLMPFGLEALALYPMQLGLGLVLDVAAWSAAQPAATMTVSALPPLALALAGLGMIWLCLWRRAWRLLGLLPLLAAGWLSLTASAPDLLVSQDAALIGVAGEGGTLWLTTQRRARFTGTVWQERGNYAARETLPESGDVGSIGRCDPLACLIERKGYRIAILRDLSAARQDCGWADIVISPEPLPRFCRAGLEIDRFTVWRNGATTIRLAPDRPRIESALDRRGCRRWTGGPGLCRRRDNAAGR